ncbi:uncharacterized protein L201_001996 [Kwoniella dendrophila CBS 6074]|uniref:Metallo-beta-lactamase domain-containing protein n=1 Tax=Kwoniella dendrophila CBS 6074 TaxID=1295534 RepID=A0AAX4JRI9_9TREE
MVNAVSIRPPKTERVKGDHWLNEKGTSFENPWKVSFANFGAKDIASFLPGMLWKHFTNKDPDAKNAKTTIPYTKPTFGSNLPLNQLKVTWLGHAVSLIELPTKEENLDALKGPNNRGVRVLFDPVLTDVIFHGVGQKRLSTNPCKIEELPEVDVIAISHNHYDHLDLPSLKAIFNNQQLKYGKKPLLFLPLNNYHVVSGLGLERENVIELDWFEERDIVVDGIGEIKLTCTPSQHSAARSGWDKDNSLWSSWAIKDANSNASVWFGGDTGYCTMKVDSHELEDSPEEKTCPAFKEIGNRLGPFTVGMIPIGAYEPRTVFSPVHAAPIDSVRMFKDTKCQNAIGIHWGTFQMTYEPFLEPPQRLKTAIEKVGLEQDDFVVVALGETKGYDV